MGTDSDIIKELAETKERAKSNSHRLDNVEEDIKEIKTENKVIYSLVESIKTISESVSDIKGDIKEIKKGQGDLSTKISEVESKPAQQIANNVNTIKVAVYTCIATLMVSGIIGAVIHFAK